MEIKMNPDKFSFVNKSTGDTIDDFKQKEGKVVELPVMPGDTVYTNFAVQGWYFRQDKRPYKAKVVFVGLSEEPFFNVKYEDGKMWQFRFLDIGKIVFLKEREALEELI